MAPKRIPTDLAEASLSLHGGLHATKSIMIRSRHYPAIWPSDCSLTFIVTLVQKLQKENTRVYHHTIATLAAITPLNHCSPA